AGTGRPGPVVVDVPKDVQNAVGAFQGSGLLKLRGYDERLEVLKEASLSEGESKAFFRLLAKSERPLIYAGGGVINSDAADALRAFAERLQIPRVTTVMGLGEVDTTSHLAVHTLGRPRPTSPSAA